MKCPYCNKRITNAINQCPHCKMPIDKTNIEIVEIQDDSLTTSKKTNFLKRIFCAYLSFWTNYIDYTSTMGVLDFWAAYTVNVIVCTTLSLIWWWLVIPYALAMVVPLITSILRRFNDVGFLRSFLIVGLIPGGVFAVLVMCCFKKDFYRNRSGLNN